ncbi:BNR repeat-containing protein [Spirosoma sp. RP8]|uniref:BNR repeat-containing protein n=1 Tax=Spirosoma liriopis TaxID=2937440 RepID=A0ABT0HMR1_9BACT|nr:BNR-4 repeat-containing protein [Spirosoma liriopis]MCK8493422.1 BNR repeat-containing protein [Spirosoma liriopis]
MIRISLTVFCLLTALTNYAQTLNQKASGYRGIWYFIGPTKNEYAYKYSGGLGTYPANHYPFSVYASAVNRTFFCYGGVTDSSSRDLCHMVGYYDHKTGLVSRPTLLLKKGTDDAHDNPVIQLDEQGYVWVFSTSHGTERPSFIHRSRKPYDISQFESIPATRLDNKGQRIPFDNFSYLQTYYQPGQGFLNLMTHYDRDVLVYGANKPRRTISFITSPDGTTWSAWQDLAIIEEGHYQTSGQWKNKVGSAFNYHPNTKVGAGLDYRTNVYYVETDDFGKTWHTAGGESLKLPLAEVNNPALVKDYKSLGLNVYISDVNYDGAGRPIILYITSKGPEPGPANGPFGWHIAHWTGSQWGIYDVTQSDHNYDMGSLYVEGNIWRIIGPAEAGPQPYGTGGNLVLLESRDGGKSWKSAKAITASTVRNQTYPRRPVAVHPDFYAFWADGNARQPSASFLYFCNQAGDVFQLPAVMKADLEKPIPVKKK